MGAYEVVVPTITGLSPSSVVEGSSSFTETITGSGFQPGATTVQFGSATLTPNVLDGSHMTVDVPASVVLDGTWRVP